MTEPTRTRGLARTSAIIGLGTLLSRVTGLLRVSALAALSFDHLSELTGKLADNVLASHRAMAAE